MTIDAAQPGSWRPRSMALGIFLVFVLHLALIFWLGEKQPIYPRRPARAPVLQLSTNYNSELLALTDPTLLALPHEQGFSGLAWLKPEPLTNGTYHPSEKERSWTDDPHWLVLSLDQLGASFDRMIAGNQVVPFEVATIPEAQPLSPPNDAQGVLSAQSSLRIEGALAQWRPLKPFELRSWPARLVSATDTDLLTNSIVQLLIDARGRPVSATLLTSSGLAEADNFALDQARVARFELPGGLDPNAALRANPLLGLCWGKLIFEWYTLPLTNRPAATP